MKEISRFIASHPLTKDERFAAWVRVFKWQLRARLSGFVTVPWIEGTKLVVRRGMTGATGNIYAGLHEFADMAFMIHLLHPEELFIDAGANIGSYTILAAGVAGAKALAIEPDPDTVEHLKRNIAENGFGNLVTVEEVALGAAAGEARFTVGQDTVNRVAEPDDLAVRVVPMRTIDAVSAGLSPVLIKMDLEGYEEVALRGATELLANPSLWAILIETVSDKAEAQLVAAGFERRFYDPFKRQLTKEEGDVPMTNALYIRDEEMIRDRLKTGSDIHVLGQTI